MEENKTPCVWADWGDGSWRSGCGELMHLYDGTLADYGFNYCPFCGQPIVIKEKTE